METIQGNLYDHPRYYDLVFGSDWKAEFDFLRACFDRHATGAVRRLYEPACGTGRLMYRLAKAGYDVAGSDINPAAVAFCNARLKRHGLPEAAAVGDMCDFRLRKKADAMFNTINSFRHLGSERQAEDHLRCVAASLRRGGLYLLGLHLTPARGAPLADEESWAARRGHLSVLSRMWTIETNRRARRETVGMSFDVYTPSRSVRLVNRTDFRIYTARQMDDLIQRVPSLRIAQTYDFAYRMDQPIDVGPETEDVVFVLQKR
ncbi:MAG: class I SAM-dependent methyltransferase [Planctomycetota bacterium]